MSRPITHWLLLFALVAMWGSAFTMTGIAVRAFSPSLMVSVRLVGCAILLTALVLVRGMRFPWHGRFWLFGLLLAVAGNCVPFWLISFGQQRVESGYHDRISRKVAMSYGRARTYVLDDDVERP